MLVPFNNMCASFVLFSPFAVCSLGVKGECWDHKEREWDTHYSVTSSSTTSANTSRWRRGTKWMQKTITDWQSHQIQAAFQRIRDRFLWSPIDLSQCIYQSTLEQVIGVFILRKLYTNREEEPEKPYGLCPGRCPYLDQPREKLAINLFKTTLSKIGIQRHKLKLWLDTTRNRNTLPVLSKEPDEQDGYNHCWPKLNPPWGTFISVWNWIGEVRKRSKEPQPKTRTAKAPDASTVGLATPVSTSSSSGKYLSIILKAFL